MSLETTKKPITEILDYLKSGEYVIIFISSLIMLLIFSTAPGGSQQRCLRI